MPLSLFRTTFTRTVLASSVAVASLTAGHADHLSSAGALAFGPDNTMFVGDSLAGQVVAYDVSAVLSDQSDYVLGRAETFEGRVIIDDLLGDLGARVGAPGAQMQINDLAVHPESGQIFLSASRGLGPDALPVLATVNAGQLEVIDLESLPHTQHELAQPVADAQLEFGQPTWTYAVTDIDYYEGEIFVAGVSGESFNSALRRISYPFDDSEVETQIEIWHAVHAQWESRAPIISQTIAVLDGEPTLVAVYACTPLVRIPLADLQGGEMIRGEMIGELGYGNSPIDLLPFTNAMDGSENILVTHTHRTANSIPMSAIASAEPMPVEVGNNWGPAGLTGFPVPATGFDHIAMINANWAAVVRVDPVVPGKLQLRSLLAPFFFDRGEHMVEMNWPGAPDPFGYRAFPALEF